jgi:hypothetical protein
MSDKAGKRKIFSPLVFSQINELIAQGLKAPEIAELIGCKVGSLRVKCSQQGISLRRDADRQSDIRRRLVVRLSEGVALNLQRQAKKRGMSQAELALALLDAIARDDLYNAVIDNDGGPNNYRVSSIPGSRTRYYAPPGDSGA